MPETLNGTPPEWLAPLLGLPEIPTTGSAVEIGTKRYLVDGPVLRSEIIVDWYASASAHRQTPMVVREWCAGAELEIERERGEEVGITVIARRPR